MTSKLHKGNSFPNVSVYIYRFPCMWHVILFSKVISAVSHVFTVLMTGNIHCNWCRSCWCCWDIRRYDNVFIIWILQMSKEIRMTNEQELGVYPTTTTKRRRRRKEGFEVFSVFYASPSLCLLFRIYHTSQSTNNRNRLFYSTTKVPVGRIVHVLSLPILRKSFWIIVEWSRLLRWPMKRVLSDDFGALSRMKMHLRFFFWQGMRLRPTSDIHFVRETY